MSNNYHFQCRHSNKSEADDHVDFLKLHYHNAWCEEAENGEWCVYVYKEGWHTPAICKNLAESFSNEDIAELKAEINFVFQRVFTFWKNEEVVKKEVIEKDLVSQYHDNPVSQSRLGDPEGFFGKVFKKARGFYHSLEGSRISEILFPWAAFDWIVLACSKSKVASRYRDALWVHYRDLLRTYFSKR